MFLGSLLLLPLYNLVLVRLLSRRQPVIDGCFELLQTLFHAIIHNGIVLFINKALDEFLSNRVPIVVSVPTQKGDKMKQDARLTVIVNLLYGKISGNILKKGSPYSSSSIAFNAAAAKGARS